MIWILYLLIIIPFGAFGACYFTFDLDHQTTIGGITWILALFVVPGSFLIGLILFIVNLISGERPRR